MIALVARPRRRRRRSRRSSPSTGIESALSVRNVVRHGGLRHLLVGHEGSAWNGVTEPGHQDGGQNGRLDPCVVVWVDADIFLLGVEGVLAAGLSFELVVGLEVGPPPNAAIDDVG